MTWGALDLDPGDEREVSLGTLSLRLRRTPEELWSWPRHDADAPEGDEGWTRWSSTASDAFELGPRLPDRPVVVAPEQPFVLAPRARSRIFVRIPLFVRLDQTASSKRVTVSEFPSVVLSDTWWGDFTDGELAYWVNTRARRAISEDTFSDHLAVCPFVLENQSSDALQVDRFAVRVAFLTLFGAPGRIWTDEVRVRYQGPEETSAIEYSGRVASEAGTVERIVDPREPPPRGLTARTFGRLRSLSVGF